MQTISDLLEAAQKIDIPYLIAESLYESQTDYIQLQQQQMLKGEREDGQPIFNIKTGSDVYSKSYAKRKGKSKPIDLYLTGAFQSEIFLKVDDPLTFTVDSADSKSGILMENYGQQIFGLNDDSNSQFIPIVQQNLYNDLIENLSK